MGKKAFIRHKFYDENVVILNLVCKIHKNEKQKIGIHFFPLQNALYIKKTSSFCFYQNFASRVT